jgi:ech hydrogenase subunit A
MAALFLVLRNKMTRQIAVYFMTAALAASTCWGIVNGGFAYRPSAEIQALFEKMLLVVNGTTIAALFYVGWTRRSIITGTLAILQSALLGWFEWTIGPVKVTDLFVTDHLSLMMLLLINGAGALIVLFALKQGDTNQTKFFGAASLLLGAMNGLVVSNHLMWIFAFWQITALAAYVLVGLKGTAEAREGSGRIAVVHAFSALALLGGIGLAQQAAQTMAMGDLLMFKDASLLLPSMAMLVLAGMARSAQIPFQNWLLKAMTAPASASALFVTGALVNAGVYIILRFSPVFMNSWLAKIVAVIGAFSFAAAALLAITQTDLKKILAYATISNMGMVTALSCFASLYAIYAAAVSIVLQGIILGLLFLCVDAVEHSTGSRDIRELAGIRAKLPAVAIIAALSGISMLLPPFGPFVMKWTAIETAVRHPAALALIIAGSAFSLMLWVDFISAFLSRKTLKLETIKAEKAATAIIGLLCAASVSLSLFLVPFSNYFAAPFLKSNYARFTDIAQADPSTFLLKDFSGFSPYLYFGVLLTGLVLAWLLRIAGSKRKMNHQELLVSQDEECAAETTFFCGVLSERKVTVVSNFAAAALIILMIEVIVL